MQAGRRVRTAKLIYSSHAYRNPIRVFSLDDLVMLIGADEKGRFLEIGVAAAEGVEFIVHAMPARPKFLR